MPKPWEHELAIYADRTVVWAGPIVGVGDGTGDTVTVQARDLTQWWERWFVSMSRQFTADDLAGIFGRLAHDGAMLQPDVNMRINVTDCGVLGDRVYTIDEYARISDKLRELSRSAVDYSAVARHILIGGSQVPTDASFILTDPMIRNVTRTRDGLVEATDVVVIGSSASSEDDTIPVGRATTDPTRTGLLQRRFDEPDIKDAASADAAAASRLALLAAELPKLGITLREGEYDLAWLVPGARVDVAISKTHLDGGQEGVYRLHDVDVTVDGNGTTTSIALYGFASGGDE